MKVSLVTVTYNRRLQLRRGLATILNQEVLPDEIIVIDDGSTDGTQELIRGLQIEQRLWSHSGFLLKDAITRYTYLDHPEPRISCIPRNVGIREAKGDIIIFAEPEGLHIGNTIKQLLEKMEQNPDSVILASQVWTMGRNIQEKLSEDDFRAPTRIINHEYAQLTDGGNLHNTKAPNSDFAITGELNCNAGVLFAVRKQWLLDIGGFDEAFEGHGWDDFDLFNRLGMYGKSLLKCPDIGIIHQWHEKNYPYNIYEAAEKNGKKSEERRKLGEFRANIGKEWGKSN